jgi:methylenetetrahydrofolate reductase (NADPH)
MARIDYDDRSSLEPTPATAPTVSLELYPPRDAASEAALLRDLPALVAADPEFISVTYGANGSSRGVSIGMLRQLQDAGVQPMAHLTCVGTTYAEAGALIREFLDSGVTSFLALRGDPPAGVDPADVVLGDLGSAAELVQLIHRMQAEREPFRHEPIAGFPGTARLTRGSDVTIAVAAFPNGHPRSRSRRQDIDTLLAKEAAGANLAITQLFFDPDDYLGFVDDARAAGVTMRILPGTLAVLSVARLRRVLEISEEREPRELLAALEAADTPEQAAAVGIEHAAKLCRALLDGGAPGLHLYTFNRSAAPLAVLGELGLYRNQEIHA